MEYTYNRQSQRITKKDQNETVHAYEHDALSRPTADKVTAVGTGVDDAVRRIAPPSGVRQSWAIAPPTGTRPVVSVP